MPIIIKTYKTFYQKTPFHKPYKTISSYRQRWGAEIRTFLSHKLNIVTSYAAASRKCSHSRRSREWVATFILTSFAVMTLNLLLLGLYTWVGREYGIWLELFWGAWSGMIAGSKYDTVYFAVKENRWLVGRKHFKTYGIHQVTLHPRGRIQSSSSLS